MHWKYHGGVGKHSVMVALTPTTLFTTPDVMLIGAAVALHAVVKLAYALFDVLAPDIGGRVLVAPIAGVAAVVIAHMASHATGGVVAVQRKVLVVLKSGWRPFLLGVALGTVPGDLLVQGVNGRLVAALALLARFLLEQRVVEPS